MLEWKDVIPVVVSALSSDENGSLVLLEFLRVLPEEVTEGRKVSLTVRWLQVTLSANRFIANI